MLKRQSKERIENGGVNMIMSKREGKAVFMKNEDGATLIIGQVIMRRESWRKLMFCAIQEVGKKESWS